jgi:hypothetical protein
MCKNAMEEPFPINLAQVVLSLSDSLAPKKSFSILPFLLTG